LVREGRKGIAHIQRVYSGERGDAIGEISIRHPF
jgi:hypothetical protein